MMIRKLKRILIVIIVIINIVIVFTEAITINTKNMTFRQKLLKAFYPVIMKFSKNGHSTIVQKNTNTKPPVSFYSLSTVLNNGDLLNFESLKGKKVLLVNTASNCGYTNQYEDLQKLSEQYKGKLLVIGFPANDFKEQEKGDDKEIAEFCKVNFGVSFPLATKSSVVKNTHQHPVFQWLSDAKKNGWNNTPPSWNFSKYLVNEQGELINYFDKAVSPLSDEVLKAIEEN